MKKVKVFDTEVTVYNDKDLEISAATIHNANLLWKCKTREYIEKNGDMGSCVLGAGIDVYHLPKRARKPKTITIINAPSMAQGSICWEHSVKDIIQYLKDNGIEAHYNCGWMD